ncbi:hypothetical protein OIU84_028265 [Salix udensis]|uniref:AMP-dependent synthetase/ligase domain-containing protein n=1 Tax=Salix udensis TaxID=889485 RepID=A0AAD6KDS6_9ROSI|nr:hypothetical protein OIU84_028265 [Salix udensis]
MTIAGFLPLLAFLLSCSASSSNSFCKSSPRPSDAIVKSVFIFVDPCTSGLIQDRDSKSKTGVKSAHRHFTLRAVNPGSSISPIVTVFTTPFFPGCVQSISLLFVLGSVGLPIRHTEFKIVDAETGEALPHGSKGIVKVRGPQVMKGYYKNPLATKQAIDEDGWLNTGDIGWIAPYHSRGRSRRCGGIIVLEGRAKDTIVLLTGENVEPLELEETAMRSSLIQQIVVIGQDQRRLGAIVVPNKDEVLEAGQKSAPL